MTIQAKVRTTTEVSSGMMMTSSSSFCTPGLLAQKTSASGKLSTVVASTVTAPSCSVRPITDR